MFIKTSKTGRFKPPTELQKTSWNNSNTVLVIQRRGRVVTDYKNHQRLLIALKLMSICQISTHKYETGNFDPF